LRKPIHIEIDFRAGIPIYAQIMAQVRQKVATGELEVGDQLPTVRQMANVLRVNFNTVARAYRLLDDAGIISTQHGRGTYIWEKPPTETLALLRTLGLEDLTRRFLSKANQQGYTPAEILKAINEQIDNAEDSPPAR
jgi:GntR family transcriptional regulator